MKPRFIAKSKYGRLLFYADNKEARKYVELAGGLLALNRKQMEVAASIKILAEQFVVKISIRQGHQHRKLVEDICQEML